MWCSKNSGFAQTVSAQVSSTDGVWSVVMKVHISIFSKYFKDFSSFVEFIPDLRISSRLKNLTLSCRSHDLYLVLLAVSLHFKTQTLFFLLSSSQTVFLNIALKWDHDLNFHLKLLSVQLIQFLRVISHIMTHCGNCLFIWVDAEFGLPSLLPSIKILLSMNQKTNLRPKYSVCNFENVSTFPNSLTQRTRSQHIIKQQLISL